MSSDSTIPIEVETVAPEVAVSTGMSPNMEVEGESLKAKNALEENIMKRGSDAYYYAHGRGGVENKVGDLPVSFPSRK